MPAGQVKVQMAVSVPTLMVVATLYVWTLAVWSSRIGQLGTGSHRRFLAKLVVILGAFLTVRWRRANQSALLHSTVRRQHGISLCPCQVWSWVLYNDVRSLPGVSGSKTSSCGDAPSTVMVVIDALVLGKLGDWCLSGWKARARRRAVGLPPQALDIPHDKRS